MGTKSIVAGGGAGAGLTAIALSLATPTIVTFEGQRNVAYRDVAKILTICNGHTGKDIVVGKVYTDEECSNLTAKDVKKATDQVLAVSPQLVWHPMVLASIISFTYNLGGGAYKKSSVALLMNQGRFVEGCNFMMNYKYADGKVFQGLVNRRTREVQICLATLTPGGMKDVI